MRTKLCTALLGAGLAFAAACSDAAPSAPALGKKNGSNAGGKAP